MLAPDYVKIFECEANKNVLVSWKFEREYYYRNMLMSTHIQRRSGVRFGLSPQNSRLVDRRMKVNADI